MPIKIPEGFPGRKILEKEHIFLMDRERAIHQDIRPLRIALFNLMPAKEQTATQLFRMLSNTPLQVEPVLLYTSTHNSTHTSQSHLDAFYQKFGDVKNSRFDGLIVTGAPVEQMAFEEVDYWPELQEVMQWADINVTSTLFLCWAAQAALYFHHGIPKYPLKEKMFGVFWHNTAKSRSPLVRGLDDTFLAPHSRHTEVRVADINKIKDLEILAVSEEAGVHIVTETNGGRVYIMGHPEYDVDTLEKEYRRDRLKGLPIRVPKNYFPEDDPTKKPLMSWQSVGFVVYSNWLNYFVYQTTPYNWVNINGNGTKR